MSHIYVDDVPGGDGYEDSSAGEVRKVVELVLRHAATTPGRTLGVITMGIKHANRIQALLDREMLRHPQLAEFFDTGRPERFFVKNLERVQGDERDVIILSVGYGKDRAGNLPPIPKRASIAEYTYQELQALVHWVQSDGKLRTHEEIADGSPLCLFPGEVRRSKRH